MERGAWRPCAAARSSVQYARSTSLRVLRGDVGAPPADGQAGARSSASATRCRTWSSPRPALTENVNRGSLSRSSRSLHARGASKRSTPSLSTCTPLSCRTVAVIALWRSCAGNPAPARLAYRSSSSMISIPWQGRRSKGAAKVAVNSGGRIPLDPFRFRDPILEMIRHRPARMIQVSRVLRIGAGEQSSRSARNNPVHSAVRCACRPAGRPSGGSAAANAASVGVV